MQEVKIEVVKRPLVVGHSGLLFQLNHLGLKAFQRGVEVAVVLHLDGRGIYLQKGNE